MFLPSAVLDLFLEKRRGRNSLLMRSPFLSFLKILLLTSGLGLLVNSVFLLFGLALMPSLIAVPLLWFIGFYFALVIEKGRTSSVKLMTLDILVVLMLVLGVGAAWYVFNALPHHYPQNVWQFQGSPMLMLQAEEAKLFQLPADLPVWKLWLAPIPFWFIVGGIGLFVLNSLNKRAVSSLLLIGWMALYLGYSSLVCLPLLQPAEARNQADVLEALMQRHQADGIVFSQDSSLTPVLFYLDRAYRFNALLHTPSGIKEMTALIDQIQVNNVSVFGLIAEPDYYALPVQTRSSLRILDAEPRWQLQGFWIRMLGGWSQSIFPKSQESSSILLFEVLSKRQINRAF
jgi:hypothetical protein